MTDRYKRVLRRKKPTVRDILQADCGVDEVLDYLGALRARRIVNHIMVIVLDKSNRIATASDLSAPAQLLVLEQAKQIVLSVPLRENETADELAADLLNASANGDDDDDDEEEVYA